VIEATQTLCDWWDVMADMQAKYGAGAPDIEEKPEWDTLQRTQDEMLEKLECLTGASQEVLFECVQQAMFRVLGMNDEVVLAPEQAQEIVRVAVHLAMAHECHQLRTRKLLN
jgi:hypothetical protein